MGAVGERSSLKWSCTPNLGSRFPHIVGAGVIRKEDGCNCNLSPLTCLQHQGLEEHNYL